MKIKLQIIKLCLISFFVFSLQNTQAAESTSHQQGEDFLLFKRCMQRINPTRWNHEQELRKLFDAEEGAPAEKAFKAYKKHSVVMKETERGHLLPLWNNEKQFGRSFPVGKDLYTIVSFEHFLKTLTNKLPFNTHQPCNVLEIGAGFGFTSIEVATRFSNRHVYLTTSDINPHLVEHLHDLSTLLAECSGVSLISRQLDICDKTAVAQLPPMHAILALNVLHYVDPKRWDSFFINCAQTLLTGGKLFLTVSSPVAGIKDTYDTQKNKLKAEWPGRVVEFGLFDKQTGQSCAAYTPYTSPQGNWGCDKEVGVQLAAHERTLPPELQNPRFHISHVTIPCLMFTIEELSQKLGKYAPQFNIDEITGLTTKGTPSNKESEYVSISAILSLK